MSNVRATLAKRLRGELERKAISVSEVAEHAGVSPNVVASYLKGEREVQFDELRPLCAALHLNLMQLLASTFRQPLLHYRASRLEDRARAADIENAFLLLWEVVPKARTLNVKPPATSHNDIGMLLAEVSAVVEKIRERSPTVEALINEIGLPILPVHAGDQAFDAFLMSAGEKSVVCLNLDKPSARMHFSLVHEVAHFLFHRAQPVPIDVLQFEAYAENISAEGITEYVANKFAQLFLVPFSDAQRFCRGWSDWADVNRYVVERRTTPEVVANGLYDVLRMDRAKATKYTDIRDALKRQTGDYRTDEGLRAFVLQQGAQLRNLAFKLRDEFADDVWTSVSGAWEIQDA